MRIVGLGVDLADIDKVASVLARFPRFAGKEAVMKSLGTGWRMIRWTDIEITGGGQPRVVLRGTAARRAAMLGVVEVLVTITHTDTTALVMAVSMGEHQ